MTTLPRRFASALITTLIGLAPAYAQTNFSGFPHSALGNASLTVNQDDTLTVSNIGSSGLDGVSVDFNGADGGIVRMDESDSFGEVGDNVQFNPLATGGAGVVPPPSMSLTKVGNQSYSLSVNNQSSGGPVSSGGAVFMELLNANGGVIGTLPITAEGEVDLFDFSGPGLRGLFAKENRDQIKTYFETGDVPTSAGFTPGGGGAPIPGVHGFQLHYPTTDVSGVDVLYTSPGQSSDRKKKKTFAQKLGGFAAGVDGGVILTGLGDAELDPGGQLSVDNIGSSGQDGVSISFGEPDLSGGKVAGVKVDKFGHKQEFGPQGGKRTFSGNENPLYESQSGAQTNPLYTGSIAGNATGGIDGFFEATGLGTDSFQLIVSQNGNPLVNELVIGLLPTQPVLELRDAFANFQLTTEMTPTSLLWEMDQSPRSIITGQGTTQLNPSLPLTIEFVPQGITNTPSGLGAVDLLFADAPAGGVALSGFAIPEPSALLLLALGSTVVLRRRA